jgi:UDP-glucose 4-epimerase
MNKLNVLLTGISSFSGAHFAYELMSLNHRVIGFTRDANSWGLAEQERILWLKKSFPTVEIYNLEQISKIKDQNVDILCLHGAYVHNYQSVDFDIAAAVEKTFEVTNPLIAKFPQARIFHTGTFSEPDESSGNVPRLSFNPYSTSKSKIWQQIQSLEKERRIAKYVMPNPFGPLESKRFTDYLLKSWARMQTPIVNFPFHVRDNVPIDLLRKHYARCVENFEFGDERIEKFYPSMFAETVQAFAQRYKNELETRSGFQLGLGTNLNSAYTEPIVRVNHENCQMVVKDWIEEKSWDSTAEDAIKRMRVYSGN